MQRAVLVVLRDGAEVTVTFTITEESLVDY